MNASKNNEPVSKLRKHQSPRYMWEHVILKITNELCFIYQHQSDLMKYWFSTFVYYCPWLGNGWVPEVSLILSKQNGLPPLTYHHHALTFSLMDSYSSELYPWFRWPSGSSLVCHGNGDRCWVLGTGRVEASDCARASREFLSSVASASPLGVSISPSTLSYSSSSNCKRTTRLW